MPEVWHWHPQGLSEMLEFETDIRQPPGGEWRDSLKDATQFLYMSHALNTVDAEKMIEAVRLNAFGDWYVPEWPNSTKFLVTLASGTNTIDVPVSAAYLVGQKVFVSTDNDNWELAEVLSKDSGSITLTAGLTNSYGGNAVRPVVVAPVVLCVAPGGVETQSTYPIQIMNISFMSMEPVDLADSDYPEFQGLPVFNDAGVPFSPLAGSMSQALDVMASRFGAYEVQEVETYTRRRGTVSWLDKGIEKMWSRRRFLHFVRGRDGEFWLPTSQNDLRLQDEIGAADLTILVKGVIANADMTGRRVMIKEGDTEVYREVTGAATVGPNQQLSIAATGVDFTEAATVSLMIKSRLDTDQIALEYQFVAGDIASACVMPTIEVP